MLIIKLLKYIIGFVNFKGFGGFTERFLNQCESENIPLWNIKYQNGEMFADVPFYEYEHIKSIANNTGMCVEITSKKGFRFFLTKNKIRLGLAIGSVACVLIMVVLSQFVWRIEVVGNVTTDESDIRSVFEDKGVKIGAKTDELNLKDICIDVVNELPNISWMNVNKKGSVLCIEVKESRVPPEMYENTVPTNVVAKEDGVIISSDVLQGVEEVKVGSAVKEGDLLISGIVKLREGGEKLVHADGFVRAATKNEFSASCQSLNVFPLKKQYKLSKIFFFGICVPLGKNIKAELVNENSSFLKSGDALLPVGVIHVVGYDFFDDTKLEDTDLLSTICAFKCAEFIKISCDTAEVKHTKISKNTIGDNTTYKISLDCEKDIARLQEIYIEKTNDIA